jgi:hypothetical protein
MKHTLLFASLVLLFSSCEEEIMDPPINNPQFTCTVAGESFEDNTPIIDINVTDMMSISVSDGTYDIDFRIYNFSTINENEVVYFSVPSMGMVTLGSVTYSNFYQPPYDGQIVFTKKTADTLSGTFNFKAQDVAVGSFLNINVKDGVFENIIY